MSDIKVLLVDDQSLVRVGLSTLLSSEPGIEVVGEAADGVTALSAIRALRPDVVLCDIRMPVRDGLALLADVAADPDLDDVRLIMLTTFELDDYVFESLRLGASGFLLKDADPADVVAAIKVVAAGGSQLAPSVTSRVIAHFAAAPGSMRTPHARIGDLTDREREIAALVARGLSNQEIAADLVVSPDTVRTHVSRAMVKLSARDRAQLVVFAIDSGLA